MTTLELLARCDKFIRPFASRYLPPNLTTAIYSKTRPCYLKKLTDDIPHAFCPPEELATRLWGIKFRTPLLNAAGMFKNAEGYQYCAAQGAGAYLAGTTTSNPRVGNIKNNVTLPFAPYPHSLASSNWLGLPNEGDQVVSARIAKIVRVKDCPIGISLMGSPDFEGEQKVQSLIKGLKHYLAAGVDFIEINESCPNTEEGPPQDNDLYNRLAAIKDQFLSKRSRFVPVIVKFSLDTDPSQLRDLCSMLIELGFDGITLGNTSTQYSKHRDKIHQQDRRLYDYFTTTFGGGLGGEIVSRDSIALVQAAKIAIDSANPKQDFHIIRAGGVLSARDVYESLQSGASLVQWYTGYFEAFARQGHDVYENLYAELLRLGIANDIGK